MNLQFKILKSLPEENARLDTHVFIDYEYLYYSFHNQYAVQPPLEEIIQDIKTVANVQKISVFGDFTKEHISRERNRIRTITNNIIDCSDSAPNREREKDFTDFIMLDHIYQDLYQASIEQYVLITGDGHFSSVTVFIKSIQDKAVGIYGIEGSLSRQLKDCATWCKEVSVVEGDDQEYRGNLLKNLKDVELRGNKATFMNTVEFTAQRFGGNQNRYRALLQGMISDGYVLSTPVDFNGRQVNVLSADWDRVRAELMFETM